ncbi:anthranilate synthase component I family protein [Sessilibacter sp. MAH4]
MLTTVEIPYSPSVELLFDQIQTLPGAVWLDSGWPHFSNERYDILSATPVFSVSPDNNNQEKSPFEHLRQEFLKISTISCEDTQLPFTHGFMGYFSYEAGIEQLSVTNHKPSVLGIPKYFWAYFNYSFVFDHYEKKAFFSKLDSLDAGIEDSIRKCISQYTQKLANKVDEKISSTDLHYEDCPFELDGFEALWNYDQYLNAFTQVKNHITDGDIYQANLTQTFASKFRGNSYWAYRKLREIMPAPYSCYGKFAGVEILSFSPETFLKKTGDFYLTKPIKGTRPRSTDPDIDLQNAQELKSSAKDQAENLMIVDLLRNDLSKNAIRNSVIVNELYSLKSYANVHHLESLISAHITNAHGLEVFKDCFPGGSITGAPKKRACEIIAELEAAPRELYCGSIGYLSASGDFDTNIAIRTITGFNQTMSIAGGGGIVADSTPGAEYSESLTKIQRLIDGLNDFMHNTNKS